MSPSILSLATAEAPWVASQSAVEEVAQHLFEGADFDRAALRSVFENAGIARRTFARPLESYLEPLGPAQRAASFQEVARSMLHSAAARALTPQLARQVTHIVTVSSSGIATPTLECSLMPALELSPAALRIPVFGLGCAGGVAALQIARDITRHSPEALVLCLCVELTSLTLFQPDQSARNFIACALFGDGAAAALVGAPRAEAPALAHLGASLTHTFPDSEELMGWTVRDEGWEVVFSQRIPAVVRREVGPLIERLGGASELRHWLLHPGGRRVLDAYSEALALEAPALEHAEVVLARHGNMSAATVFFVIERCLRDERRLQGPGVAMAMGPGFSANAIRLDPTGARAR